MELKIPIQKILLNQLIANYDNNNFNDKSITLLDALRMIKNAMLGVTKKTIQNCFVKSGFKSIVDCDVLNNVDDGEEMWQSFKDKIDLKYATFKDYVAQDDDPCRVETLNDNAIMQRILQKDRKRG